MLENIGYSLNVTSLHLLIIQKIFQYSDSILFMHQMIRLKWILAVLWFIIIKQSCSLDPWSPSGPGDPDSPGSPRGPRLPVGPSSPCGPTGPWNVFYTYVYILSLSGILKDQLINYKLIYTPNYNKRNYPFIRWGLFSKKYWHC